MKVKTLMKYQLKDMKYVFLVLYLIIIFNNLLGFVFSAADGEQTSNTVVEMASSLTFFIAAICCFSETFHMWVQNGMSRKNIFKGFLSGTIFIAAICTALNCILVFGASLLLKSRGYFSVLSYLFEDYFRNYSFFLEFIINVLFIFVLGSAAIMAGYLIAILFYRAGKIMKVGIAAGLPIFIFGIVPILYSAFMETAVVQKLTFMLLFILGIESNNPFYLIATLTVTFILLSIANYLIIRKLQVNTHS